MKKRRILAVTLALVALMMCGLTSFAVSVSKEGVKATLERWGPNGSRAVTETVVPTEQQVYVALTEEYMSSLGNFYVSSPVINTSNSGTIDAEYTPNGYFVSAWSDHGRTGKLFTQYLS